MLHSHHSAKCSSSSIRREYGLTARSRAGSRRFIPCRSAASVAETTVGGDVKLTGASRSHETDVVVIGSGKHAGPSYRQPTVCGACVVQTMPAGSKQSFAIAGMVHGVLQFEMLLNNRCAVSRYWWPLLCSTAGQVWGQGREGALQSHRQCGIKTLLDPSDAV